MSSISQTGENCGGWVVPGIIQRLWKPLAGFFRNTDSGTGKRARIWHGIFSYPLVPDTAIRNFNNMSPVTSISSGDCYICIFERDNYQGDYQLVGPGERVRVNHCASLVVSARKFSIEAVRKNAAPPGDYWEMDGPMYMMHFSSGYRYV